MLKQIWSRTETTVDYFFQLKRHSDGNKYNSCTIQIAV